MCKCLGPVQVRHSMYPLLVSSTKEFQWIYTSKHTYNIKTLGEQSTVYNFIGISPFAHISHENHIQNDLFKGWWKQCVHEQFHPPTEVWVRISDAEYAFPPIVTSTHPAEFYHRNVLINMSGFLFMMRNWIKDGQNTLINSTEINQLLGKVCKLTVIQIRQLHRIHCTGHDV